jgi:hypothetical protein
MTTPQILLVVSAVIVAAFALLMAKGMRMHGRLGDNTSRVTSAAMTVLSGVISVGLLAGAMHWVH